MSPEFGHTDRKYLEILQEEITDRAKLLLNLKSQLSLTNGQLKKLIEGYQKERHDRQEALWRERSLIRCTVCFDVPPTKTIGGKYDQRIATAWGGWGLMPMDDAHFVITTGTHTIDGREYSSDKSESFAILHRLCGNCFEHELEAHAARGRGRMRRLEKKELERVLVLINEGKDEEEVIETTFGHFDYMKIKWQNLQISEEAYEIGQKINLEELLTILKGSH